MGYLSLRPRSFSLPIWNPRWKLAQRIRMTSSTTATTRTPMLTTDQTASLLAGTIGFGSEDRDYAKSIDQR